MNITSLFQKTGMNAKLAIVFVLIGLLPLIIVGSLYVHYADQSLRKQILSKIQVVIDSKAQRIEGYLLSREVDVTVHSKSPTVLAHLEALSALYDREGILSPEYEAAATSTRGYFARLVQTKSYDNVLLIDASGQVVFSLFPTAEFGSARRLAPNMTTPLAKVFDNANMLLATEISDYEMDTISGGQKAYVAAPIFRQGVLAGVLALRINNRALFEIAQDYIGLGDTGESLIGRLDGDTILLIAPTRHDPSAAFHRKFTIHSQDEVELQEAIHGNSGIGQIRDYRGQQVLAAWKYLPTLRCGLVVKMDVNEALAPVWALSKLSLVLGIVVVALVALLAPLVVAFISAPLRHVAQTTRAFTAGDRTRRTRIDSKDELGNLATAFNQMADTIEQQILDLSNARDDLELRVTQRTAELAISNEALLRQQTELRVLFDFLPAMLCFKDTENGILRVNQQFADYIGKPIAEIEGKSVLEVDPEKAVTYFADDLEVIRSGEPMLGVIETVRRPGGKELWIQKDRVPVCDLDGKVTGIVVMVQDITERKRADESLRLLGSAVEQATESILITDADLDLPGPRIIFVNPAFTKMTGYTAAEVLGKTPRILQGSKSNRAVLRRLRETLGRGETFDGETTNYRKDRTEFNLEWQVTPIRDSSGTTTHFVAVQRDITERKRAENALRESDEKFHQLADNISDVFWIRSPDMREVHYLSPAFEKIWGRSMDSLHAHPEQWSDFILPEDRERVLASFQTLGGEVGNLDIEYRIVRPGGEIRWVRTRGFQVRDATDQLIRHAGIVTDITERKKLETQLVQSQKMETVGKLAGGIAHEFNSILTAIIGQSELLLNDLPAGSPFARNATAISKAAMQAATLTRQLLAFGRKQVLLPETLDLNRVIASMAGIFNHLIGGDVDIQIIAAVGLHSVKSDVGQIEQVLINMVMNARDAMPKGGKLTLETANITFDEERVGRYPELKPGNYVMLAISDSGVGMSTAVRERAFEPFFTTKGIGEGTGLGLSTCYGIIKQSGGHISIYSELGRGTTFKIYLPQVESLATIPVQRPPSPGLPHGTETILLVEDDPTLREMASSLLSRLGYKVLVAANGVEALRVRQEQDAEKVDLLFTDIVMPNMSGKELADRVRASYPQTRILFTSAYTENAIFHQGDLNTGAVLLQKPFTPSALAHKLREVLDQPAPPKPDTEQEVFDRETIVDAVPAPITP